MPAPAQTPSPPDDLWTWVTTGNAPNYVAVVVAAVAAIFAFRSSQASRRSADAAQQQLKRVLDDKERELADALHLMITKDHALVRAAPLYTLEFDLLNDSEQWVFDVFVYRQHQGKALKICAVDAVPPGLSPGFFARYVMTPADTAQHVQQGVGYLLRDAHGKYWHLTPAGTLSKLENDQYVLRGEGQDNVGIPALVDVQHGGLGPHPVIPQGGGVAVRADREEDAQDGDNDQEPTRHLGAVHPVGEGLPPRHATHASAERGH